jgi:hypothetical protein
MKTRIKSNRSSSIKKRYIFCSLEKKTTTNKSSSMCSLPLSYKYKHIRLNGYYCLKKIRHYISLHSVFLSFSLCLSLSIFSYPKETYPYTVTSWLTAFLFFCDNAKKELLYFSPTCMTYTIEKRYFIYVDEKKI